MHTGTGANFIWVRVILLLVIQARLSRLRNTCCTWANLTDYTFVTHSLTYWSFTVSPNRAPKRPFRAPRPVKKKACAGSKTGRLCREWQKNVSPLVISWHLWYQRGAVPVQSPEETKRRLPTHPATVWTPCCHLTRDTEVSTTTRPKQICYFCK